MPHFRTLTEIAAESIPAEQELHDRQYSILKNIQFSFLKDYDKLFDKYNKQKDEIDEILKDIHGVVSCRAKDDYLYDLTDDIWSCYDEVVYNLVIARGNFFTDMPNYANWSYISSRIMVCPSTNRVEQYTDENYHMFESCYQRWDLYGKMDAIQCEEGDIHIKNKINDYFSMVREFIDIYRKLYKDDRENAENFNKILNVHRKKLIETRKKISKLSMILNKIDTILTDHSIQYFCLNCGQISKKKSMCCEDMTLILDL